MWGMDLTTTETEEGQVGVFVVVDHYTAELLSVHATFRPTRFEAIYALGKAVKEVYGQYDQDVCKRTDLRLRHDHGSQFTSRRFQEELKFLGIIPSPGFVSEPETKARAERIIKTLKEQVLWIKRFSSIEELQTALHEFKHRYNTEWLIQRHGFITPSEARRRAKEPAREAA